MSNMIVERYTLRPMSNMIIGALDTRPSGLCLEARHSAIRPMSNMIVERDTRPSGLCLICLEPLGHQAYV
ncbi:hypothetical protein CEXT_101051 [Caerostris extrusa]|uniref:Uncharacterized protein n=1 Tax=Caerostris extrusa TaxID=172846 RepID=A0AAV4XGN3_CAEEX|nr:hypothetical protein CEXT_101051 [Caerostris extrusa]